MEETWKVTDVPVASEDEYLSTYYDHWNIFTPKKQEIIIMTSYQWLKVIS